MKSWNTFALFILISCILALMITSCVKKIPSPHGEITSTSGIRYHTIRLDDGKTWLQWDIREEGLGYTENPAIDSFYNNRDDRNRGYYYTYESAQVACSQLGPEWRLPTKEDWDELINAYTGWEGDSATGDFLPLFYLCYPGEPYNCTRGPCFESGDGFTCDDFAQHDGLYASTNGIHNTAYDGSFHGLLYITSFWSATPEDTTANSFAWAYILNGRDISFHREPTHPEQSLSCRCVSDVIE